MAPESDSPGQPGGSLAPLDRAALERVMARAAELQARSADAPEHLTDAQILALGSEVGISSDHLRQALAEERTRVALPDETGVVGSWFGASHAVASRVVPGKPADVLAQLDGWMQREELLRVRRRIGDRLTWEARRDFMGSMQASFNIGGRPYALTPAAEVGATVVAVDAARVLVRLEADFGNSRRRNVAWAGGVAGLGATSGVGVVALSTLSAEPGALVIGAVVGSVWTGVAGLVASAVARSQRRKVARGQLALEQILDRLEHGEIRSSKSPLMEFLSSVR
ncbi:MAG: hypothetical protein HUU26_03785 [Gemmatimonadaceae bacterium]|nr:hypothetical protein [Gemmatimonadaceae bacterium]